MTHLASMLLTAPMALVALSSNAFAGTVAVPEPGTLALLGAGVGALAAIKILRGSGGLLFAAHSAMPSSSEPPARKENLA